MRRFIRVEKYHAPVPNGSRGRRCWISDVGDQSLASARGSCRCGCRQAQHSASDRSMMTVQQAQLEEFKLFIHGNSVDARSGRTFESQNPIPALHKRDPR
jgi:hypothetical protein